MSTVTTGELTRRALLHVVRLLAPQLDRVNPKPPDDLIPKGSTFLAKPYPECDLIRAV
jgi:hypothetical protein